MSLKLGCVNDCDGCNGGTVGMKSSDRILAEGGIACDDSEICDNSGSEMLFGNGVGNVWTPTDTDGGATSTLLEAFSCMIEIGGSEISR